MTGWRVICGDVRERLAELPDGSVQCCVTSPPYWGLRDYGHGGQIGLEPTPDAFVAEMVRVFAEVRRVLADDGVCWLNLGDTYAGSRSYQVPDNKHRDVGNRLGMRTSGFGYADGAPKNRDGVICPEGCKPKDLIGIPWRVAFALQADGWYLRSDIIWAKPNPMPESVTDRPTKSHEYIFLLSKSARYFYNAAAIAEPVSASMLQQMQTAYDTPAAKDYESAGAQDGSKTKARIVANARAKVTGRGFGKESDKQPEGRQPQRSNNGGYPVDGFTRNARSVWTIPTQSYPEAHFATFPEELPTRCILAGSREGDTVLDPFCGSGTTGAVAVKLQRNFIGIELNPAYVELARKRIGSALPMFAQEVGA